jgi:large subunit ribosomal protein L21
VGKKERRDVRGAEDRRQAIQGRQERHLPGGEAHAEAGETVQFNEVLMLGGETVTVGAPRVEGAAVQAEVLEQMKGPKVISFVKRRRKHSSKRTRGHRQQLTRVRITEILTSGADASGVKAAI